MGAERNVLPSITDTDVIKTGGEWVSSLELENCAMSHPQVREGKERRTGAVGDGQGVCVLGMANTCSRTHPTIQKIAMAAVIGLAHPKWDERPLLVAVKKEGACLRLHGGGCSVACGLVLVGSDCWDASPSQRSCCHKRGAAGALQGARGQVVDSRRRGLCGLDRAGPHRQGEQPRRID